MKLWDQFSIAGIITETRELTSQKNKDWRGYVIKIATLGKIFELTVDQKQFNDLAAGQNLEFIGHFEEQRGNSGTFIKYILDFARNPGDEPMADKKKGAA